MKHFLRFSSLFILVTVSLLAQNSGVISGTITDSSQAVIPNAQVTIVNADTGVTVWRGATTNPACTARLSFAPGATTWRSRCQASSAPT